MKILIATGIFPPDIGGPATYSKLLADELPKQGAGVEVLSFGSVRHLPKLVWHTVYFFSALSKGKNADIIFAQDPVSVGLPAMFASKILRKKFALKVVGDYAWEQGIQRFGVVDMLDDFVREYARYVWQVRLLKRIQAYVARKADIVLVPSEYLKTIVAAWGIADGKIHVVHNALDIARMPESKEASRKALGLEGTIIFSAGRLVPWKGFEMLIDIMPEILGYIPNVVLFIAGDGPERHALAAKIKKNGLSGKVALLGKMPQDKLLAYVKASDVFALNTGYEGFSHQILEAMACGTPVVSTHVGGNAELIQSGSNGLLVPYNDAGTLLNAIVKVLRNPDLARQLAQKAMETSLSFSKEKMLHQTMIIFSKL